MHDGPKAQSAMEFLVTYGWALIIVGIMVAFMFQYITAQSSFASRQCQFAYGVTCNGAFAYSNAMFTNVSVKLNNSQSYLVLNPNINVSIMNYGNYSGGCRPAAAAEGNGITCNVIFNTQIKTGTVISGILYVNVTACPSNNKNSCQPPQMQTYVGNFSTQVSARKYS
ncbi:MAG: hypothetical protein KGH72_00150 [Candidatus Micrarchaeota archaeon]|nr:hypothetical protein [Candidatus Micrarchaeota archaeon]